jgi:hypothetical protein
MAAGVNGMDYMKCTEAGVTHAEILEIAALSKSLFDYADCRTTELSVLESQPQATVPEE